MDSYYFTCILFSILTSSFFLVRIKCLMGWNENSQMYLVFVKVTTALKKERENTYDVNMKYSVSIPSRCITHSNKKRVYNPTFSDWRMWKSKHHVAILHSLSGNIRKNMFNFFSNTITHLHCNTALFQASANMLMVGALTVILLHITPQLPDYVPLAHSLLYLLFICTRVSESLHPHSQGETLRITREGLSIRRKIVSKVWKDVNIPGA